MVYIYPSYPELLDLCGRSRRQAIEAASMSQFAGWGVMASHRSGETEASPGGDWELDFPKMRS
jgi:hypothetical protein